MIANHVRWQVACSMWVKSFGRIRERRARVTATVPNRATHQG
jgi:hypothetical protein